MTVNSPKVPHKINTDNPSTRGLARATVIADATILLSPCLTLVTHRIVWLWVRLSLVQHSRDFLFSFRFDTIYCYMFVLLTIFFSFCFYYREFNAPAGWHTEGSGHINFSYRVCCPSNRTTRRVHKLPRALHAHRRPKTHSRAVTRTDWILPLVVGLRSLTRSTVRLTGDGGRGRPRLFRLTRLPLPSPTIDTTPHRKHDNYLLSSFRGDLDTKRTTFHLRSVS